MYSRIINLLKTPIFIKKREMKVKSLLRNSSSMGSQKSLLNFRKRLFDKNFIHKFTWTHVMTPLKIPNKSTSSCIATLFRQIFKGN